MITSFKLTAVVLLLVPCRLRANRWCWPPPALLSREKTKTG